MRTSQEKWRKSEGGVVGRFGDPRKALKSVALVFADGDVNPARQSIAVDPGVKLRQLKMRLLPVIDRTQLTKFPDESLNSLGLTLVLRDPSVKRFTLIGDWDLESLPETVPLDEIPEFERIVQDRIILTVGLTVLKDDGELEVGTTLARKDFHIHTEASGNQFPHQFVDSQYFVDQGLPKTTSWFVHVLNEDGDRPADGTFVVYINRDLVQVASSKGADAIWASLATDTMAILMLRLLKGEVPEDPITGSILDHLDRQISSFGHSLHDISGWVRDSDISKIMALSQSITRVNSLLRSAL